MNNFYQNLSRTLPVTNQKKQMINGLAIGLSVALILIVFQPFGTYRFEMNYKQLFLGGYGFICAAIYVLYYGILMQILKRWFQPAKWNFIREVLTIAPVIVLMACAGQLYHHWAIGGYTLRFSDFVYFTKISFAVASIPFFILIYRKWMQSQLTSIKTSSEEQQSTILFESNNKKEKAVSTTVQDLIYVKSNGNYIEIACRNQGEIKKHLIRNTLNQVEGILPEEIFLKIHRSYILNTQFIESLQSDNSSYSVKLKEGKITLPVSRSMAKTIREMI